MKTIVSNAGVMLTNYTRYDSEDLLALVNLVEAGLNDHGCQVQWTGTQPRILFRKYATKTVWKNWNDYDADGGRQMSQVRNYTSTTSIWNAIGGGIGIVIPGKIFDDPLAELAALSEEGTRHIPYAMFRALWSAIIHLYPTGREAPAGYKLTAEEALLRECPSDLQVRIKRTSGDKRVVVDAQSKSKELYRKKLRRARYYATRARDAAKRAAAALEIARKHALRSGIEFDVNTARLQDTVPTLGDCCIDIVLTLKALSTS
jgi:hypothetical protein